MTESAKAAVLAAVAEKEGPTIFEKLFGKLKSSGATLAYASADASATGSIGPTQKQRARRIDTLRSVDRGLRYLRAHGLYA